MRAREGREEGTNKSVSAGMVRPKEGVYSLEYMLSPARVHAEIAAHKGMRFRFPLPCHDGGSPTGRLHEARLDSRRVGVRESHAMVVGLARPLMFMGGRARRRRA